MQFRQLLALTASLVLCSCTSASQTAPDSGTDAGIDGGKLPGGDAGLDGGLDAGADAGPDAGQDAGTDAGTEGDGGGNLVVTFQVPAAGGTVQVTGSQVYSFTFPADVSGQSFTIEVLPSDSFGFDAGEYVDIFKLGPNGTQFTTPVFVAPADTTNLPDVAFLYPEPVVASGAEVLFAVDGGYFIPHFSAYAHPAPPNSLCSFDSPGGAAGTNSCVPFTYSPLGGWVGGNAVDMQGKDSVSHSPCTLRGGCMQIECWTCVDDLTAQHWQKGNIWCSGWPIGYGFAQIGWQDCPDVPAPSGCQLFDGRLSSTGCGFIAKCSGTSLSLSCSGGQCSCSGGSSSATFPQGSTCLNVSNGFAALAQKCP